VADEADRATELAQDDINQGLAAVRRDLPDPANPGPRVCPECEEVEIPEGRRRLGHHDCIECARAKARRDG